VIIWLVDGLQVHPSTGISRD